jgi:hypothetical protein
MKIGRLVIYKEGRTWYGAGEFTLGLWPFQRIEHAPITHADTAEEVFAWLRNGYPHRIIAYDPSVTKRYSEDRT